MLLIEDRISGIASTHAFFAVLPLDESSRGSSSVLVERTSLGRKSAHDLAEPCATGERRFYASCSGKRDPRDYRASDHVHQIVAPSLKADSTNTIEQHLCPEG